MKNILNQEKEFRSQFGEDRLLSEYFRDQKQGWCVEVGAYDGVEASNTFYFENIGWNVILIEAHPDLVKRCQQARPSSQTIHCAVVAPNSPNQIDFQISHEQPMLSSIQIDTNWIKNGIISGKGKENISNVSVPAKTLDNIMKECYVPQIDFITIDVEGYEWAVLQGFTPALWLPKIIIVERNTTLPDRRIMKYMRNHGYVYERTTGVNDWYISKSSLAFLPRINRKMRELEFYMGQWARFFLRPVKRNLNKITSDKKSVTFNPK